MNDDDKDIDFATSGWLKKVSLEEPSDNFSMNVMKSIYALERKKADESFNYWWLLLLVPVVFLPVGWFISGSPELSGKLYQIWEGIVNYYYALNTSFGAVFSNLKSITISPVIILVFLAILSLLVVEDIFSKSREKLNPE